MRVKVRAWVNGRPIFNDELMQWAGEGLEAHQERRHERRVDELTPRYEGYMGATILPGRGPGTAKQKADREVRRKKNYHQSSSSDDRSSRHRRRDSDDVD